MRHKSKGTSSKESLCGSTNGFICFHWCTVDCPECRRIKGIKKRKVTVHRKVTKKVPEIYMDKLRAFWSK